MAIVANLLTGRALLFDVNEGDSIEFTTKNDGKTELVQGVISHISAFAGVIVTDSKGVQMGALKPSEFDVPCASCAAADEVDESHREYCKGTLVEDGFYYVETAPRKVGRAYDVKVTN